MSEKSERFINHLRRLDRKAYAELRRSLSKPPGQSIAAIPYVERFTLGESRWRRDMYYLVAGLFCLIERPVEPGAAPPVETDANLGKSIGTLYIAKEKSSSTERRFIRLLDADAEQLGQRLRQMLTLLRSAGIPVSWPTLLDDLLYWHRDDKEKQHRWARAFYQQDAENSMDENTDEGANDTSEPKLSLGGNQ